MKELKIAELILAIIAAAITVIKAVIKFVDYLAAQKKKA
jgi:hypothetical protein